MAFIIGKCQVFIPEMCIGVLTTFIQACSLNRKRKAHKITCLYPLEIPDLKPPDAFGIPIVSTPPCLRNSSSKNPPLPSEFQKAVRRTVRIFSGIAQSICCHKDVAYCAVLHRRTGRGGWGGCSPPKFWATQIFWAAKEICAKPVLKEVSMFLFFEEIDIFYFNLKSAW